MQGPAKPEKPANTLPAARSVLAVCAHPDDETFGLGATLHAFAARGTSVSLLCFTHGEASTLGASEGPLGEIRRRELDAAAAELGIHRVELFDYADGTLNAVPLDRLSGDVAHLAHIVNADLLVVFDKGGITGHPDHCRATEAALASDRDLPVLAWCVPRAAAERLYAEFGVQFTGRDDAEIDFVLPVDRKVQWRAIAQHASQSTHNPVLERRLELHGDREVLRWLRAPNAPRELRGSARA